MTKSYLKKLKRLVVYLNENRAGNRSDIISSFMEGQDATLEVLRNLSTLPSPGSTRLRSLSDDEITAFSKDWQSIIKKYDDPIDGFWSWLVLREFHEIDVPFVDIIKRV